MKLFYVTEDRKGRAGERKQERGGIIKHAVKNKHAVKEMGPQRDMVELLSKIMKKPSKLH